MDISAWQALFRTNAGRAEIEFHRRRTAQSEAQQRATWSHVSKLPWTASSDSNCPLCGVPFAVKDLFPANHQTTRAGSAFLRKENLQDSALVSALRDHGAIPVGTTHLHEFAYGLTGENPHYGRLNHPLCPDRTTGGSSSGSAATVAAGVVPFALGTDTGGSLRVPAAYCGIYSWRDVPQHLWIKDAFPLAPSFDTAGWLASNARDLQALYSLLVTSKQTEIENPRFAFVTARSLGHQISSEFETSLLDRILQLVGPPTGPPSELANRITDSTWAYAVLQSSEAFGIHQRFIDAKKNQYGEVVWQRIDRGRHWTARQLHAARLYQLGVKAAFSTFFRHHDFVVMPVAPTPALKHDDCDQNNRDALLAFNTPVSLAGLPVITVPVFLQDGLSLGLQFIFPSRTSSAIPWLLERCHSHGDLPVNREKRLKT